MLFYEADQNSPFLHITTYKRLLNDYHKLERIKLKYLIGRNVIHEINNVSHITDESYKTIFKYDCWLLIGQRLN